MDWSHDDDDDDDGVYLSERRSEWLQVCTAFVQVSFYWSAIVNKVDIIDLV